MNSINSTLQFPSQEVILAHLKKQQTPNYLEKDKMLDRIAAVFANKALSPIGVEIQLLSTLKTLTSNKSINEEMLAVIGLNLAETLKNCANQTVAPNSKIERSNH